MSVPARGKYFTVRAAGYYNTVTVVFYYFFSNATISIKVKIFLDFVHGHVQSKTNDRIE